MRTQHFFMPIAVAGALAVLSSCASGEQTSEPLMEPAGDVGTTAPSEPDETTGSSPPTTSAPATISEPTGEPTPTIPEVEAANEDEQAVIDTAKTLFEEVEPQLQADPESDLSVLDSWATGQAKGFALDSIKYTRSQEEGLVGEIHFAVLEVSVNADQAVLQGCYDAMQADFLDTEGTSVISGNRYPSLVSLVLIRDDGAAHGWIVSEKSAGGTPCAEW